MAYEARITGAAKAFHEKMFPGYVSDFLRTDPEFIERFDTFAFDEVVAQANLDDEIRYLGWLATLLGCQGIDEYRAMLPAALRQRELATFCYIATQGGCGAQTKAHAAANLSVGNTKELLVAVVSSNLPFIGYPRTLNALAAIEDASK